METKIKKPTILVVEETRQSIIKLVNDSNLPAFMIEPILREIYDEVQEAKVNEYKSQKKSYEEKLAESESTEIIEPEG